MWDLINYYNFKKSQGKEGGQSDSRMISNHIISPPLVAYAENGVKNK